MIEKPARGGRRTGAGRKPKSDAPRVQKSINLPPSAWALIAENQRLFGGSESDAILRMVNPGNQ
jgi:hypothetical protein